VLIITVKPRDEHNVLDPTTELIAHLPHPIHNLVWFALRYPYLARRARRRFGMGQRHSLREQRVVRYRRRPRMNTFQRCRSGRLGWADWRQIRTLLL
jgi:hypothetical protein